MQGKINQIILGSALALIFSSSIAFAEGTQVYVGVEGGANHMNFDTFPTPQLPTEGFIGWSNSSSTTDANNAYANIHLGFLTPVNSDWSLGGQIGFANYGKANSTQTQTLQALVLKSTVTTNYSDSYQAVFVEFVAQRSFGDADQYFVNLHAGAANFTVDQTASSSVTGVPVSVNLDGQTGHGDVLTPMGGVGLGYKFSEHFNAYVNYTLIAGDNGVSYQLPMMNSLGLGVNYVF